MGLHRSYSFFCIRHILLFIPFCTESLAVRDRKIQPSKMYEYKCVCVNVKPHTPAFLSLFTHIFVMLSIEHFVVFIFHHFWLFKVAFFAVF